MNYIKVVDNTGREWYQYPDGSLVPVPIQQPVPVYQNPNSGYGVVTSIPVGNQHGHYPGGLHNIPSVYQGGHQHQPHHQTFPRTGNPHHQPSPIESMKSISDRVRSYSMGGGDTAAPVPNAHTNHYRTDGQTLSATDARFASHDIRRPSGNDTYRHFEPEVLISSLELNQGNNVTIENKEGGVSSSNLFASDFSVTDEDIFNCTEAIVEIGYDRMFQTAESVRLQHADGKSLRMFGIVCDPIFTDFDVSDIAELLVSPKYGGNMQTYLRSIKERVGVYEDPKKAANFIDAISKRLAIKISRFLSNCLGINISISDFVEDYDELKSVLTKRFGEITYDRLSEYENSLFITCKADIYSTCCETVKESTGISENKMFVLGDVCMILAANFTVEELGISINEDKTVVTKEGNPVLWKFCIDTKEEDDKERPVKGLVYYNYIVTSEGLRYRIQSHVGKDDFVLFPVTV